MYVDIGLTAFLEFPEADRILPWAYSNPAEKAWLQFCPPYVLAVTNCFDLLQLLDTCWGRGSIGVWSHTPLDLKILVPASSYKSGRPGIRQILRALQSYQSLCNVGLQLSLVHFPVVRLLPNGHPPHQTVFWIPLSSEVIGSLIKVEILGILIVPLMIIFNSIVSIGTTKPGPCDAG